MKRCDFILLSEDQKKTVLLHNGVLVAKRKDDTCSIFLFQMDGFYVEVFGTISNKKVKEYRTFEGTNELQPYLDLIPIDGLF